MELIFPGIVAWRGALNVDPEFSLRLWKQRYEVDRGTEWTGDPDDGPMQHFERGYGPLRCRNFELPDGLGRETEEEWGGGGGGGGGVLGTGFCAPNAR